jgi:hypothetical protein
MEANRRYTAVWTMADTDGATVEVSRFGITHMATVSLVDDDHVRVTTDYLGAERVYVVGGCGYL